MLRRVIWHDVDKFWSQTLTGSMEGESIAAVLCPVIRKARPPLVFTNPEPPPWGGVGPGCKRNIPVA